MLTFIIDIDIATTVYRYRDLVLVESRAYILDNDRK